MTDQDAADPSTEALARLRKQVLQRWSSFPQDLAAALDSELAAGLAAAAAAKPRMVLVANPVSRLVRLRLAPLASDHQLDTLYQQEWAEIAVGDRGVLYLVYARCDGTDHGWEWSHSTTLPESLAPYMSEALASALFDTDRR